MKKDLLICIAAHFNIDRKKYLECVLQNISDNYKCSYDIIIDTNSNDLDYHWYVMEKDYLFTLFPTTNRPNKITIISHTQLQHPFNLTQLHRQHIKDNIDNYNNFMYIEDDMYVPYANYLAYLEKFKILFPFGYVPSFVRIEMKDDEEFISDVPEQYRINESTLFYCSGKSYVSFKFPYNYCAFWIMPSKELKETMTPGFARLHDSRESAASYVSWELQKTPLIEINKIDDKYFIDESCYSYHLPNTYALMDGYPNGKIKLKEIFI
jgi:hypothetical protein